VFLCFSVSLGLTLKIFVVKTIFILLPAFLFTSLGVNSEIENLDCPAGQISYGLSCGTHCDTPPSPWTTSAIFAKTAQLEESICGEGGGPKETIEPN
jgi:hypothetical protein